MFVFLIVIHVIASLLLILSILLQAGRGGGLSEMFASSSTQTILGTSATDVLKKATTVSAIVFLCTSLTLAIFSSKRSKSLLENVKVEAPQSLEIPITTTEVKEEPAVEETQTQDKK